MIKPIRKEKNSIYHDSFYRNKKRSSLLSSSPIKWWILLICLLALGLLYLRPVYASQLKQPRQLGKEESLHNVGAGQLLFSAINNSKTNQNSPFNSAVLINSSAHIQINGLIANVTLTQSFINQSGDSVNGVYVFPLPENSAVNHLHIQVADRVIEGKIMEKAQALKVFTQAKKSGKKASLVQQFRPNLFTNHIANIAANEQITVTIKYFQHIDFIDGKFNIRFPMKITPRYQVQQNSYVEVQNNKNNESDVHDDSEVSDDALFTGANSQLSHLFSRQKTKYVNHQENNKIQLTVELNAGIDLTKIISASHRLNINDQVTQTKAEQPFTSLQKLSISVGNVQIAMDRDFILEWYPSASNEPRLSVFKQILDGDVYSLAMLLPPIHPPVQHAVTSGNMKDNWDDYPAESNSLDRSTNLPGNTTVDSTVNVAETSPKMHNFTRDITFIIDTSGSMQGPSIKQAKQSLRFALHTLNEQDSFNIIAFESRYHQAFNTTVMATTENKAFAKRFIDNLQANGGTEMYQPLAKALKMPTTPVQVISAIKQVIFITDGAVSNEVALFKLIHDTPQVPRLFMVGIGSAPNGYFMRKAAQFGRGSYTYIGNINEVNTKVSALLDKISKPALRNISVLFQPMHLGSIEQYPKNIPDLYENEPLLITFKTSLMPKSMQIFGEQSNKAWQQEVNLSKQQESSGITPIWARSKIEDLLDGLVTGKSTQQVKAHVLATSLKHQVISPYSSFIAVEQKDIVENKTDDNNKQATVFPKTALGWQAHFLTGILLLIISLIMQARRTITFNKNSAINEYVKKL